ncbi:hypothetical protein KEM48_003069 [Puccinia striiformis f. sp. tritici PST-130]|nr:hypothetical protein KEM48_003069 [Puccinia striiformis f. sp. tritici PST-130]
MLEFLQDNSVPYQSIILALSGGVFAFEQYLNIRQLPHLKLKVPPPSIAPYLLTADGAKTEAEKKDKPKEGEESLSPQETFMKSQAYALDKVKFSMIAGLIDQVETWALLSPLVAVYFGGMGRSLPVGLLVCGI